MDYTSHFKQHLPRLAAALQAGQLQVTVDPTPFRWESLACSLFLGPPEHNNAYET